ncbi:hypothetical protein AAFF_G00007310 [Aldrovandia affinis]|uniref:Uncharacterized protein n=1 Tax=Aldrovandia affinis TaxID=143900 RepID=A0AAD7WZV4_9TELE|nr:hypothetical protein AAFF_G00007310 [Aldrovandia affinis]
MSSQKQALDFLRSRFLEAAVDRGAICQSPPIKVPGQGMHGLAGPPFKRGAVSLNPAGEIVEGLRGAAGSADFPAVICRHLLERPPRLRCGEMNPASPESFFFAFDSRGPSPSVHLRSALRAGRGTAAHRAQTKRRELKPTLSKAAKERA